MHRQGLRLDQTPESLLPLLAFGAHFHVSALEVLTIVILFFATELLLCIILVRLHIRKHPW